MAGISLLKRGMIIDVNLDPTQGSETGKIRPCVVVTNDVYNELVPVIQVVPVTQWSSKKIRVRTNVELQPTPNNGLSKQSIADCLQTRPVDHRHRLIKIRGTLTGSDLEKIDTALRVVFSL